MCPLAVTKIFLYWSLLFPCNTRAASKCLIICRTSHTNPIYHIDLYINHLCVYIYKCVCLLQKIRLVSCCIQIRSHTKLQWQGKFTVISCIANEHWYIYTCMYVLTYMHIFNYVVIQSFFSYNFLNKWKLKATAYTHTHTHK